MTLHPCAKINLGLNIVAKRADGYHLLETVFYPIPLHDTLEIQSTDNNAPSPADCHLQLTGNTLEGNEHDNLVLKAYRLVAKDYPLPPLRFHLHKEIPSQAGMGGGSSDAAFTLKALNEYCRLQLNETQLRHYALQLGADCPFFITPQAAFAQGIGEQLSPLPRLDARLHGLHLVLIKPTVAVSTGNTFKLITPRKPRVCCKDVVLAPIETWKEQLTNDFEAPIFAAHPELKAIKDTLYSLGAAYASMSGSGSTVYGIFEHRPEADLTLLFPDTFTRTLAL